MTRTRTDENAAFIASAVIAASGGTIDRATALRFVTSTLKPGKQTNMSAAYLDDHADGLTSGSSAAPPGVTELVRALRRAGHRQYAMPRCERCDGEKKLPYRTESGRVCTGCFTQLNARPCSTCGRVRPVCTTTAAGVVCGTCWRLAPERQEICTICAEARPVARRLKNGPICPSCYTSPPAECDGCGKVTSIHSRRSGRPLCRECYVQPERRCSQCGTLGRIVRRASPHGADGDLCERCYEAPQVECVKCGRLRRCSKRSAQGPLCQSCYDRPTQTCIRCQRDRPVQRITEDGPVCSGCYDHIHRVACTECGEVCRPYAAGVCARCVLRARLDDTLGKAAPGGPLEPVREALLAAPEARSVLRWMIRPGTAELLSEIGSGTLGLSHEAFDEHERSKPLDHLRDLLAATGVLPPYDPAFERLAPWLDARLADVATAHAQIVRPFAVWGVFRRLRRKAELGRLTENGAKWARLRVNVALDFLGWLDDHNLGLADVRQADIDLWLASGPTTRYVVRDFIVWCRTRKLIGTVTVPLRQPLTAVQALRDDERWAAVENLLHNDDADLDVRVGGLFALLFGQHLSRVSRMRTDDIVESDGVVTARFGDEDLVLPPVLDELVLQLLDRRGHSIIRGEHWLFPGGSPGRPITAEQFRKRLAREGIELRATRNSALMALAAELPAPILADMLGLHDNTAVAWVRNAAGDWSAYAAERTMSRR